MNQRTLFPLAAALLLSACSPPDAPPSATVTLMTFNVENLFDTADDPGKDDETYLPLAAKQTDAHVEKCAPIPVDRWREDCLALDWSDAVLEHKLSVIAETIRQIPGGPDIIALQEVEHAALLERLRAGPLADLGYGPAILIEGQDRRGIDVGFLSRLPLAGEAVLHPLEFPEHPDRQPDTRGVLEATFVLPDGGLLTGFAVHFPAPFHPTDMRVRAYEHLNALRRALPDDRHAFAAGDFNTTSREAAETGLLERLVRPDWTVAHETGCADCPGTQYYARDDSWSFLDMILWSPPRSKNATWAIRADSARLANLLPAQKTAEGTPRRYDAASLSGVSDHWPLAVEIQSTQKQ